MKIIDAKDITAAVRGAFLSACIAPGEDVAVALCKAENEESSPSGREILCQLIDNNKIAKDEGIPSCQDTGMAVVYLEVGQDVHIINGLVAEAVNEGVRRAYAEGYFRKSVLTPINRENTGDNTPAVIHTDIVPGSGLKIIAMPKGFGSENMSAIRMLKPSDGREGIEEFILETVRNAGGSPCPPVVLGVGIGGTFDYAATISKKQLLREVGSVNPDPQLAQMEKELKDKINALGIGPMGLGGDTYCLAVHIAQFPTHIAGLPVAVNFSCHALRHTEVTL
jgi:fumarate hydratase subunit alpha